MATANLPKPEGSLKAPPRPRRSTFESTLRSARSTMMFSEVVRLAVDSFKASKVRFLLTMLGMIIGSASIILVYTLGLTGKDYALNLISSIGPNMIEMQYNGGTVAGPENTTTPDYMTRDDQVAVLEQVPGIVASSPMLEYHDMVSMGGGITRNTMILGVSLPVPKEVRNLAVVAGRFFDDQDTMAHEKVADIVEPFARALYGSNSAAVGRSITVAAASPLHHHRCLQDAHRYLRSVRGLRSNHPHPLHRSPLFHRYRHRQRDLLQHGQHC